MNEALRLETEGLIRSWDRHEGGFLRDYLVSSVEDPRINVQSILARHFLLTSLYGERFARLMEQELLFAAAMAWLTTLDLDDADQTAAVLHALRAGADNAEGRVLPRFIVQLFRSLPLATEGVTVPNYLVEGLMMGSRTDASVFEGVWARALAGVAPLQSKPKVIEAACGSANDYRYLHSYGMAALIDYRGFDLSVKNIANAQTFFPGTRFEVGNAFSIQAADQESDYYLAQDLFEHLSLLGLEAALNEACRVTRRSLCLGFFNMDEIREHQIKPVEDYHWNKLSMERVRESLASHQFETRVIHIDTYLRWLMPGQATHNPNAYTLIATRMEK